jgi:hypothetical protein
MQPTSPSLLKLASEYAIRNTPSKLGIDKNEWDISASVYPDDVSLFG